jgi:hypothetical protein
MEERTLGTTEDRDLGADQGEIVPPNDDPIGSLGLQALALVSIRFGLSHLVAAPEPARRISLISSAVTG